MIMDPPHRHVHSSTPPRLHFHTHAHNKHTDSIRSSEAVIGSHSPRCGLTTSTAACACHGHGTWICCHGPSCPSCHDHASGSGHETATMMTTTTASRWKMMTTSLMTTTMTTEMVSVVAGAGTSFCHAPCHRAGANEVAPCHRAGANEVAPCHHAGASVIAPFAAPVTSDARVPGPPSAACPPVFAVVALNHARVHAAARHAARTTTSNHRHGLPAPRPPSAARVPAPPSPMQHPAMLSTFPARAPAAPRSRPP